MDVIRQGLGPTVRPPDRPKVPVRSSEIVPNPMFPLSFYPTSVRSMSRYLGMYDIMESGLGRVGRGEDRAAPPLQIGTETIRSKERVLCRKIPCMLVHTSAIYSLTLTVEETRPSACRLIRLEVPMW